MLGIDIAILIIIVGLFSLCAVIYLKIMAETKMILEKLERLDACCSDVLEKLESHDTVHTEISDSVHEVLNKTDEIKEYAITMENEAESARQRLEEKSKQVSQDKSDQYMTEDGLYNVAVLRQKREELNVGKVKLHG